MLDILFGFYCKCVLLTEGHFLSLYCSVFLQSFSFIDILQQNLFVSFCFFICLIPVSHHCFWSRFLVLMPHDPWSRIALYFSFCAVFLTFKKLIRWCSILRVCFYKSVWEIYCNSHTWIIEFNFIICEKKKWEKNILFVLKCKPKYDIYF